MKSKLYLPALITFLICTAITFIFAAYNYPLLTHDSQCFVPPSYFINHTGKLINPLYDGNIDPVQHRFIFYPPLFPYVIAYIARIMPSNYNEWYMALTTLDAVSILLLIYTIYRYIKLKNVQPGKLFYYFMPLLVIVIFSFQGIMSGRPDILCRLFITLFILNNLRVHKWTHFLNGVIIGLTGLTSPIYGFYLVLMTGYLFAYRRIFKPGPILSCILGGVPVLLLFLLLYPYPLTDMLNGMSRHSQNVIFNRYNTDDDLHKFIIMHIASALTPLSFVTFGISFIYITLITVKNKRYLALLMLFALAGVCSYFTFVDLSLFYNLYVLSPVVCFLLPIIFTDQAHLLKSSAIRVLQPAIMLLLFANCTGLLRKALILYATQDKYVSAAQFRNTFLNTLAHTKPQKKIIVSLSLWPYCIDKADRILQYRSFSTQDTILRDTSAQYLIVQQNNSGLNTPMQFANFKLIQNQFITDTKKLAGVTWLNTYPGYQVAIYERK